MFLSRIKCISTAFFLPHQTPMNVSQSYERKTIILHILRRNRAFQKQTFIMVKMHFMSYEINSTEFFYVKYETGPILKHPVQRNHSSEPGR